MKMTFDYTNLFQHKKMPDGLSLLTFLGSGYLCEKTYNLFLSKRDTDLRWLNCCLLYFLEFYKMLPSIIKL